MKFDEVCHRTFLLFLVQQHAEKITHTHTEPSLDHLPQLLLEVSKLQLAWSNYKLDEQLSSKMQSDGSLLLHLLGQKSVPKQITIRSFLETYVLRC